MEHAVCLGAHVQGGRYLQLAPAVIQYRPVLRSDVGLLERTGHAHGPVAQPVTQEN